MFELLSQFINPPLLPQEVPLKTVNLFEAAPEDLKRLFRQVKHSRHRMTILVHPYCETVKNNKPFFPPTSEYCQKRDMFIKTALRQQHPLVIFEEATKCSLLTTRVDAREGALYYIPTLPKDSTPALIQAYPQYNPCFMQNRTSADLESKTWDILAKVLKSLKVRHISVGGRYMVLHHPTNENGFAMIGYLENIMQEKKAAQEWITRDLIPSACPGKLIIKLLTRGFDTSISEISSPTDTLTPTDLSEYPYMKDYY